MTALNRPIHYFVCKECGRTWEAPAWTRGSAYCKCGSGLLATAGFDNAAMRDDLKAELLVPSDD